MSIDFNDPPTPDNSDSNDWRVYITAAAFERYHKLPKEQRDKIDVDVLTAILRCDFNFGIWLANQMLLERFILTLQQVELLAVYGWVSQNTTEGAAIYLRTPWTASMNLKRAAWEASYWLDWLIVHTLYGAGGIPEPWRADGIHRGFTCRVLRTAIEFRDASAILENCLFTYGSHVLQDECRVVLLLEGTRVIGAFELRFNVSSGMFISPYQILGVGTRPLREAAHRAMYAFLADAPSVGTGPALARDGLPVARPTADLSANWQRLLGPYFEARGASDMFLLRVSSQHLATFRKRVGALRSIR
jgi:hypothetical protein